MIDPTVFVRAAGVSLIYESRLARVYMRLHHTLILLDTAAVDTFAWRTVTVTTTTTTTRCNKPQNFINRELHLGRLRVTAVLNWPARLVQCPISFLCLSIYLSISLMAHACRRKRSNKRLSQCFFRSLLSLSLLLRRSLRHCRHDIERFSTQRQRARSVK